MNAMTDDWPRCRPNDIGLFSRMRVVSPGFDGIRTFMMGSMGMHTGLGAFVSLSLARIPVRGSEVEICRAFTNRADDCARGSLLCRSAPPTPGDYAVRGPLDCAVARMLMGGIDRSAADGLSCSLLPPVALLSSLLLIYDRMAEIAPADAPAPYLVAASDGDAWTGRLKYMAFYMGALNPGATVPTAPAPGRMDGPPEVGRDFDIREWGRILLPLSRFAPDRDRLWESWSAPTGLDRGTMRADAKGGGVG